MTKRGKKLPEPKSTPPRPKTRDDEARPVFEPLTQDQTSGVSASSAPGPGMRPTPSFGLARRVRRLRRNSQRFEILIERRLVPTTGTESACGWSASGS